MRLKAFRAIGKSIRNRLDPLGLCRAASTGDKLNEYTPHPGGGQFTCPPCGNANPGGNYRPRSRSTVPHPIPSQTTHSQWGHRRKVGGPPGATGDAFGAQHCSDGMDQLAGTASMAR